MSKQTDTLPNEWCVKCEKDTANRAAESGPVCETCETPRAKPRTDEYCNRCELVTGTQVGHCERCGTSRKKPLALETVPVRLGDPPKPLALETVAVPPREQMRDLLDVLNPERKGGSTETFLLGPGTTWYPLELPPPEPPLTLDAYAALALRTANYDIPSILRRLTPDLILLVNAGLGVAGEAGELADEVKKILFHGKGLVYVEATATYTLTQEAREKLVKEAGDVLWYLALLSYVLRVPLEDIAKANVEKLKQRYPEGFTEAAAAARVDTLPGQEGK